LKKNQIFLIILKYKTLALIKNLLDIKRNKKLTYKINGILNG
jgi:hypothetical protein